MLKLEFNLVIEKTSYDSPENKRYGTRIIMLMK